MSLHNLIALTLITLTLILFKYSIANKEKAPVTFTFPEYQYKETTKNEITFREYESACEQNRFCSQANGIAAIRCVRECISPSCYKEIYQMDQLEEGEIDVRLNSFKGCFIQKSGRHKN